MMRLTPAFRTIALATVVLAAGAGLAAAAETTTTVETTTVETKPEAPFSPTIYVGPGFGYANAEDSDFGWSVWATMRIVEYGAIQIEYFNVGDLPGNTGNFDGLYVGLMPIYPVTRDFGIFGQIGGAFSEGGDDVAGGGGLLYMLPIEFLRTNKVDATVRLDYKYLNIGEDGSHLLTLGIMLGFHK